jgi:tripartite-type tricarboxylate transporter receptor subunit TctC
MSHIPTLQESPTVRHRSAARGLARAALALAALASTLAPSGAAAQAWPARPVRWILSQPAGSGPDLIARAVAERVARMWEQPIVIENRPGGQNVIGAQAAAKAPADGYTFYYGTTAALITNAYTFKSLPYDPDKDFTGVAMIGKSPFVIAAGSGLPAKTLAEALAAARAQPGALAIATEGQKTFSGMLADVVQSMSGTKLVHVPYTKAGDAIQDTIGGRTALVSLPAAALNAQLKAGTLRALAVSTAQRLPWLPEVPTLAETFPGFEFTGWNALVAPTGTPAAVIDKANRDLDRALREPELAERLLALGSMVEGAGTPASVATFLKTEREAWGRIVRSLGIQPE